MDEKIKILFVASGNSKSFKVAPFISAQGESLQNMGLSVDYFPLVGKGIKGYLKNALLIRKEVKKNKYSLIHAHYTMSGWSSVLAFSKIPVVLSLMGSDAYGHYIAPNKIEFSSRYLIFLTYLIQPFVKAIICKSKHIESFVFLKKKSFILPNGILLNKFTSFSSSFHEELNLSREKRYILFLGNTSNVRKNFKLLENAFNLLNRPNVELLTPYPIKHEEVVRYLNTVDVIVVPSLMEGSPNIVKEAMACNCPVIATNVGDVEWLFGDEPGHFLTNFDPADVAEKIKNAIDFVHQNGRTNGRERIIRLGLDSETVAKKIINVYHNVLNTTAINE